VKITPAVVFGWRLEWLGRGLQEHHHSPRCAAVPHRDRCDVTPGPSNFHVQLYNGSQDRAILLLAFLILAVSVFGQSPQIVLGSSQIQSSRDNNASGMAEAFPVTAPLTGQVSSLYVFLDRSNTAATAWVGLYTSGYHHPRTLLTQSIISNPVAGQWNAVAVPPVQVTQGTRYWIALLGLNGQIQFRDSTGYCHSETSQQINLTSLPGTWSTGSRFDTCMVSMFGAGALAPSTPPPPNTVSLTLSPSTAALQPGQQAQFTATVSGTSNSAVNWAASGGTISSTGMYKAPSAVGTYTVTATSAADPTKSSSATVTVAAQVSISISPTTSSLQGGGQQLFVASISGTTNMAVTWSASAGTIASNGTYTAPSAAGNYTVTAISVADPTKSASALVSVSLPQAIAVQISPPTVSMPQKWQQQFSATVSGSSNGAVTWSVRQGIGTITQSGLYTAPQNVETDVVTATSQVDSTKSASAIVTIFPPHSVSLTWMPSSSSGVSYNVYRGTVSGGPYNLLKSGVGVTNYTDSNVQSGSTYYYVTTAVDASGLQSVYSDEAQAVIPMP